MNFRRWFTVLSVLVLFVGLASAQSANSLTCSANTTGTPTIRGEGYTELIGDIVLTCTGGSIQAGAAIPQVNITVAMNQPVTSRLLAATGTTQPAIGTLSDAVLFVDDPGAMNGPLAGWGPNATQQVCNTPLTGCGGVAAQLGGYNVPVLAGGTPGAAQVFPNVFQGIVNGNQVTFNGVPVLPPGTSASRTFRITNVRINATSLYQSSANLIAVSASISTNPSMYLPLQVSQPVVAYVTRGLNGTSKTTGTLTQCSSPSSDAPAKTATITFQEQFQTAFKTRISPLSGVPSYGATLLQTSPGGIYNSESGLTITGLQGVGSGMTPGMANYPTRIKATFYNIPVGISGLYVDSTPVLDTGVTPPATPGDTSTVAYAQLLTGETADAGSYVTVAKAPLTISSTQTATAVWEITNANANAFDTLKFNVYVAYTPNSATNQPSGTAQVVLSYAPTYDPNVTPAAQYASATLPVPRFAFFGTTPADIMKITPCQTVLLWPYVTTFTGFNTGIAISNTSKDPGKSVIGGDGTTAQAGTCALYLYGAAEFGTAPTMPLTTPSIAAGTTWSADLAGLLGSSYSVSTGYLFAVCNFQYAHGYAAISDVHFDKFLSSYLALVVDNAGTPPVARGIAAENFNQ